MNTMRSLAAGTALALALSAGAAEPTPILNQNPGFLDLDNDGAFGDGWGVFGAAAVDFQFFGDGNPGHATLFGDNIGNTGGVFQAGIPAEAGKDYELTIHIQWESEWDAATYYGLEFYDATDGTKIGESIVEIVDEFPDFGYRRYDLTATAPAGTAFVRPIVSFDSVQSSGASRAATVDNVLVREADDVLTLNPSFGDAVGAGTNGTFWDTFGAAALDLDFFNNGNPGHATLFADMAGNSGGVFQLGVPAIAGESYTMTVDLAFEANWDAVTQIELEFYGIDDGFLLGEGVVEVNEQPGAGYVTYTVEATAPLGFTAFVRPLVVFSDAVGAADQAAATVDNLVVQLTSTVGQGCNPADLAEPFGQLTFADISGFLGAFSVSDPSADLAPPIGQFTFADISAFLTAFAAGCP